VAPEVWSPVAHGKNQPDEFTFIRGEGGMAGDKLAAEERHQTTALMQHCPDAHARCITLHYERLGEDWEMKHERHRERRQESVERGVDFRPPSERILAKQSRERCCDVAVAFNETLVVSSEPQESVHHLDGARWRPVEHRLHFSAIHGDTHPGDDMAEVGDLALAEFTLGALDEELRFQQLGEDQPNMKKVLCPAAAVDQDVIEKD
jgi:hypothetical protein